eukprot:m.25464 g.25464  ORF g.25464 m.25464 type:complete len:1144 (+) comp13183_c0_seq5:141-3572(+)
MRTLVRAAVLYAVASLASSTGHDSTSSISRDGRCTFDASELQWYACRLDKLLAVNFSIAEASVSNTMPLIRKSVGCVEAEVPGTIFNTLLRNKIFAGVDDPFDGDSLRRVPDIAVTGAAFYTYVFMASVQWVPVLHCEIQRQKTTMSQESHKERARIEAGYSSASSGTVTSFNASHTWLTLRGVSYRAQVFSDGHHLFPVEAIDQATDHDAVGMNHRWTYNLEWKLGNSHVGVTHHGIAVVVHPPDFPGDASQGGQGGDHQIARNAAMMQYAAGWDWVQATPDRNTGLWDAVAIESTGPIRIADVVVRTVELADDHTWATLQGSVELLGTHGACTMNFSVLDAYTQQVLHTATVHVAPSVHGERPTRTSVLFPDMHLTAPHLWWPHTLGPQPLYTAVFSASVCDSGVTCNGVSSQLRTTFGVRKVDTRYDERTWGRIFAVNGMDVFLQGGNWIGTDQFLRFASDADRYDAEVRMHRDMGLNLIRVWGGGVAERPEFFDACDKYGVFVWSEFWMTGDNNGRWAGSYSWPDDHTVYMANVNDTIRMQRNHPSLLLWVGGNELYPEGESPPPTIRDGLVASIAALDPGRFYIPSTMSNWVGWNPDYALAPKDGPYGFLAPSDFSLPNPGLRFGNGTLIDASVKVGFEPEVGSSACPTYASLQRFLNASMLAQWPAEHAGVGPGSPEPPDVYTYHKHLPFSDDEQIDHVYALGVARNTSEYAHQAQLAQYMQFKQLFEGFQEFMWTRYTAVLFWKTQSPWPTFRGALYDSYLAQTGGYYGVRSAAAATLHVQFNHDAHVVVVVNRGRVDATGMRVGVRMYTVTGARVPCNVSFSDVAAPHQASVRLTAQPLTSCLRAAPSAFIVLFLDLVAGGEGVVLDESRYWLNRPPLVHDFRTSLEPLRSDANLLRSLAKVRCTGYGLRDGRERHWTATLTHDARAAHVAFGVEAVLERAGEVPGHRDPRVLPTMYTDQYLVLVPGATAVVNMSAAVATTETSAFQLRIRGYNVLEYTVPCVEEHVSGVVTAPRATETSQASVIVENMTCCKGECVHDCKTYVIPLHTCFSPRALFPGDEQWGTDDIRDECNATHLIRSFFTSTDGTCSSGGSPDNSFVVPLGECVGPFGKPRPWGSFTCSRNTTLTPSAAGPA